MWVVLQDTDKQPILSHLLPSYQVISVSNRVQKTFFLKQQLQE